MLVTNGCCPSVVPPTLCWQQILSMIWDHSNDSILSLNKLAFLTTYKAEFYRSTTYCSQSWFVMTPFNSFLVIQIIDYQVVPILILFNVPLHKTTYGTSIASNSLKQFNHNLTPSILLLLPILNNQMNITKAKFAAIWKPYSTGATLLDYYTFVAMNQKFQKSSDFGNNFTCWLLLNFSGVQYFPFHST